VPQDSWLVVVLGQNELGHGRLDGQQFRFGCSMRDVRARKRFLIDLRAIVLQKGTLTLDLENNREIAFLPVHD
jgi:hypothetical protein